MQSWLDEATGRRVTLLSTREEKSQSFYFHNNPFLEGGAEGDGGKMVFIGKTPHGPQFFTLDLASERIEQITHHECANRQEFLKGEIVSRPRREIFYWSGRTLYATHVDTRATRVVVEFPEGFNGRPSAINCDGTLLAGVSVDGEEKADLLTQPRSHWFRAIFEARFLHRHFTLDAETGEMRDIYQENAWLNHLQFSPTDPGLLMFCHEGPWHLLDRIWLLRTDGSGLRQIHQRTVDREIWGHEFWDPGGRKVWFDLQIPKGERFFVAGVDLETDRETRYEIDRNEWSVHFNVSPDGKLFCGDGGDENMVAHAPDGKWIYLFRPDGEKMRAERLCSMATHNYRLEPNVHFTPDMRRVVFRSNMDGHSQIYAVDI